MRMVDAMSLPGWSKFPFASEERPLSCAALNEFDLPVRRWFPNLELGKAGREDLFLCSAGLEFRTQEGRKRQDLFLFPGFQLTQ
jgi:hypothetical protein